MDLPPSTSGPAYSNQVVTADLTTGDYENLTYKLKLSLGGPFGFKMRKYYLLSDKDDSKENQQNLLENGENH